MKLVALSAGIALAFLALASPAAAVTTGLCDFTNLSGVQLNGNAGITGGNVIRLAPNVGNVRGSAFLKTPVPFPAGTSFHTWFRFMIGPNAAGGDGLAFILQSSAAGATAIGNPGQGLGYGGILTSGIVEFDTYANGTDPNANHVGLMFNGDPNTHVASAMPPFALASNQITYAWIDFDGAAKSLSVSISQSPTRPASPLLVHTADFSASVGAQAFAGFTASTGGASNNHDLLGWEFSTDGVPCACEGSAACGGATPVCGPAGVCVACAADADCAAPAVCDVTTNTCVGCLDDTKCSGATPLCDLTTRTCAGCAGDYVATNPPELHCPTPQKPACVAGKCDECSATNASACAATADRPVCVASASVCGCAVDADCGAGRACDTSTVPSGVCVTHAGTGSSGSGTGSSGMGTGAGAGAGAGTGAGGSGAVGAGGGADGVAVGGGACQCGVPGREATRAGALAGLLLAGAIGARRRGRRR